MGFISAVLKSGTGLAVFIAIAVGIVGKKCPELFLMLPMGFIAWAMTGNPMPPYFVEQPLYAEHFRKWAQDGDVILSISAKSGTAWLQQIVHVLKTGNDTYPSVALPGQQKNPGNQVQGIGYMEAVLYPGQTFDDRLHGQQLKRAHGKPMQWFSHKAPGEKLHGLNVRANPKIKYIVCTRNGKEVVRSFYAFLNGHSDEFRKMWGGFPPKMGSPEEALKFATVDMPEFYFGYIKNWWPHRHEPNVLMLHYADLKKDLRASVQRVADFLELGATSERIDVAVEKASFDHMKANDWKFHPMVGKSVELTMISVRINEGKCDGAAEFFTPEMSAQWEAVESKEFDSIPGLKAWAANGGPLP